MRLLSLHRVRPSPLSMTLLRATAALALCLPAPVAFGQEEQADQRAEIRRTLLGQPGMSKITLDIYKGQAALSARLNQLVSIGVLCHLLGEEDAQTINAAATADLDDAAYMLDDADRAFADAYRQGVVAGMARAGDPMDQVNDEGCARFAKPGGLLTKIMTWTGKPQYTAAGTLASPRTIP